MSKPAHNELRLAFSSGELNVREALRELRDALAKMQLNGDDLGSVEVVLGEVLNNVVEHSYGPDCKGEIKVHCAKAAPVLRFEVEDSGVSLPGERLPEGELPSLDVERDDLPEGGFGWYLVRNLACDLVYRRYPGRNVLAFSIPFEGGEVAGAGEGDWL